MLKIITDVINTNDQKANHHPLGFGWFSGIPTIAAFSGRPLGVFCDGPEKTFIEGASISAPMSAISLSNAGVVSLAFQLTKSAV
jgi:hypothetical protein